MAPELLEAKTHLESGISKQRAALRKYGDSFSKSEYFTFGKEDERKKKYRAAYAALSLELSGALPRLLEGMRIVSELTAQAFRQLDEGQLLALTAIADAYGEMERALFELTERTEKELCAQKPSVAVMTELAKRLDLMLDRLVSLL